MIDETLLFEAPGCALRYKALRIRRPRPWLRQYMRNFVGLIALGCSLQEASARVWREEPRALWRRVLTDPVLREVVVPLVVKPRPPVDSGEHERRRQMLVLELWPLMPTMTELCSVARRYGVDVYPKMIRRWLLDDRGFRTEWTMAAQRRPLPKGTRRLKGSCYVKSRPLPPIFQMLLRAKYYEPYDERFSGTLPGPADRYVEQRVVGPARRHPGRR